MAGIYLHIPFCRHKCSYCDFYSVARKSLHGSFIEALKKEILSNNLDEDIQTIYWGGGTPSLIPAEAISEILNLLFNRFSLVKNAEITIEANPEDISEEKLRNWKNAGINRLSIGVQSLNDNILKTINRRHTAKEALDSISMAQQAGFDNISADLIYGLPGLNTDIWQESLKQLLKTGIQHLSSYHLGLEPGTLMYKQVKQSKIILPDEEESIRQFEFLFDFTEKTGYPWYEISNFARPGMESRHNSSYWNSETYLGFGPGAHSYNYNLGKRFWNKPDINAYIKNPSGIRETEILTGKDILNDYLITHLRTRKGISIKTINLISPWIDTQKLEYKLSKYITDGKMEYIEKMYRLKANSLLISDAILKDIIYI